MFGDLNRRPSTSLTKVLPPLKVDTIIFSALILNDLEAFCQGVEMKRTLRHPEGVDDGLHQAQHEEGAAAHVGQEEHDADASSELRTQRSADHV